MWQNWKSHQQDSRWQVEAFVTSTVGSACLALRAPWSVALVNLFRPLLEKMYLMMPCYKMIASQWKAHSLTGCRPVPIMPGHL